MCQVKIWNLRECDIVKIAMNIKTIFSPKPLILILSIGIIASVLSLIIFLPPGVDDSLSMDLYRQIKSARYWLPEDISKVDEAKLIADYDAAQERGLKLCHQFLRHYPDSEKALLVKLHQIDFLWALGQRGQMLKRMQDFLRQHPQKWRKAGYVRMLLAEESATPMDEKSRYYFKLAEIYARAGVIEKCAEMSEKATRSAKTQFSQIYRRLADMHARTYQYDIAVGEYQKAIELVSDDYRRNLYRLLLADCFRRTGKPDVAQKMVTGVRESTEDALTKFSAEERLLAIATDMERLDEYISKLKSKVGDNAVLHEMLGNAYERKQDYPPAMRAYIKAIELGADLYYPPLINLCNEAQLYDEGIVLAQKAVKSHPKKAAFRAQLGYFLGERGMYEEGVAEYKKAIKLAKGKKHKCELRLWLGRLYRKAGETLPAETEWESIIASKSAGAELKRQAEEEIYQMYDAGAGVAELLRLREEKIQAKPNDITSLRILGRTHWQMWHYEDATNIYERVMRLAPEADDVWRILAKAYEKKRDYDKAISLYQRLLEFAPVENARYLTNISNIETRRGRQIVPTKIAFELGEKLAAQTPKNAELHLRLADVYFQHHKLDKSIAEYKKALEIDADNMSTYDRLATIYAQRREDGKIIDLAEQLKGLRIADIPLLHHTLGRIYTHGGFYDEAIAAYEQAVKWSPDQVQFRKDLAKAYEIIGEFEKADAEYEKVMAMAQPWERLEICQRRGKIDKLLETAIQIIDNEKMDDRENEIVSLVIDAFTHNGQLEQLIAALAGNIAPKSDDVASMKILAAIHLREENLQQAADLYGKITLLRPDDWVSLGELGKTYYLSELYAQAQTAYEKALNLNPERFEYKEALARCYEKTGQPRLASEIRKNISRKYGGIYGSVRQAGGKGALANAQIQYVGPLGIKGETNTDAQGNYRIENLVWGRYLLRASLDGYALNDRLCLINAESENELIFFLTKATSGKSPKPRFPRETSHLRLPPVYRFRRNSHPPFVKDTPLFQRGAGGIQGDFFLAAETKSAFRLPAHRPMPSMKAPSFVDENAVEPKRQAAYITALSLVKEGAKAQKGRRGKLQKAITLFSQIAQKYPRTVAADFSRIQIAICYQLLRDWEEAAKSYETLANKYARKYSNFENIPREPSRQAAIYAKDSFIRLSSYNQSVRIHQESMRKLGYPATQ